MEILKFQKTSLISSRFGTILSKHACNCLPPQSRASAACGPADTPRPSDKRASAGPLVRGAQTAFILFATFLDLRPVSAANGLQTSINGWLEIRISKSKTPVCAALLSVSARLRKRPAGSVLTQRSVPRQPSSHFEDPCNTGTRFADSARPQPAGRSSASRANSCSSLSESAPASWSAYGEKQGEPPARPAARTGPASRGCAQGRHREENSVADGCNCACSCYFRYRGVGHCWKSRTSENTKQITHY
jgi:hypothetical protein